ncbi:SH3 domain-containing protein [uncultured Clostridium sp.]|uniref:SH3 domain-containing protein n=1 Tax=uncultured Clostridium sp. TaxID=59620 RepID=UPI0028ECE85B|nr:SH3 domain-containing protein [uncultured Clostridium sp.]
MRNEKMNKLILALGIVFISLHNPTVKAYTVKSGIVNIESLLNVRENENIDSKIIYKLVGNADVTIVDETEECYKVRIGYDLYGYVDKDYITLKEEPSQPRMEENTEEEDKYYVDNRKSWTITFNKKIKLDEEDLKGVTVEDEDGKEVPVYVKSDENKISVFPEEDSYQYGETYTLNIKDNIKSFYGDKLKEEKKMEFKIKTENECFGLGEDETKYVTNDRPYEWYTSQHDTGKYSNNNSNVACATMALKWIKSDYNKSVEYARSKYINDGKPWDMDVLQSYLEKFGVKSRRVWMSPYGIWNDKPIIDELDKGNILIFGVWVDDIEYNPNPEERVGDFHLRKGQAFSTNAIIVKGYKIVDGKTYFEIYDPACEDYQRYLDGTLKGKNRYYSSEQLSKCLHYKYFVVPENK